MPLPLQRIIAYALSGLLGWTGGLSLLSAIGLLGWKWQMWASNQERWQITLRDLLEALTGDPARPAQAGAESLVQWLLDQSLAQILFCAALLLLSLQLPARSWRDRLDRQITADRIGSEPRSGPE
jgi:hypothetical protein